MRSTLLGVMLVGEGLDEVADIARRRYRVDRVADAEAALAALRAGARPLALVTRFSEAETVGFLRAAVVLAPRVRRVVCAAGGAAREALAGAVRRGLVDIILREPIDELEVRLGLGQLAKLGLLEEATGELRARARPGAHEEMTDESSLGVVVPPHWAGLPPLRALHDRLLGVLAREAALACVYVDAQNLKARRAARAGACLGALAAEVLRGEDLVCEGEDEGAFLVFLSAARATGEHWQRALEGVVERLAGRLEADLGGAKYAVPAHEARRVAVGAAQVLASPLTKPERLLARLVTEARESASFARHQRLVADRALLQELILGGKLRHVYQPVVALESGEITGYEALVRGPAGSPLEPARMLLALGDELGLLYELDRACLLGALRAAAGLEPGLRLYVNCLPELLEPAFLEGEVMSALLESGLAPASVVLELDERRAGAGLRRRLETCAELGFGVAIAEVGARGSNLEAVLALAPSIIKLADSATRGVAESPARRELLRGMVRVARAAGAIVIAEGVERAGDLQVLHELGVELAQGWLLAHAGEAFPLLGDAGEGALLDLAGRPPARLPDIATAASPAGSAAKLTTS